VTAEGVWPVKVPPLQIHHGVGWVLCCNAIQSHTGGLPRIFCPPCQQFSLNPCIGFTSAGIYHTPDHCLFNLFLAWLMVWCLKMAGPNAKKTASAAGGARAGTLTDVFCQVLLHV
jgi:hypothetical protein